MSLPVSAEWSQLNDRFYRKREVYTMSWQNMDLAKYHLVAAPFGGPLALWRDERKLIELGDSVSLRPTVNIYTSSGRLLSSTVWDRARLIGCGFSDNDRLVCVVEDGTVLLYTLHGEQVGTFSLGRDVRDAGVRDCRIWGSGLVVLTEDLQLLAITNFTEPRPIRLHPPGLVAPPKAWVVVEPQHTQSLSVEVLLATDPAATAGAGGGGVQGGGPGTIILVNEVTVQDQLVPNGPFSQLALAPSGKLVACLSEAGKLLVTSLDFVQVLSEFDTKSRLAPAQMAWCSNDTLLLYWQPSGAPGLLLMVGPFNEWIKYSYEPPDALIYLLPEIDGARVISNQLCEFIQRVPDMVESVFKTGSTTPPAMLYDALDYFEKRSPKADELMRSLRATPGDLAAAVSGCLQAAAEQQGEPNTQRTLLKAASLGMLFVDYANPAPFVDTCRTIRVLNDVGHFEVGLALTHAQYTAPACGPQRLLDRLVEMHEHYRALRIAEHLGLRRDRILLHWACAKVRRAPPDHDPSEQVIARLVACGEPPGVSYAEIASTAYRCGRKDIATRLLEHEPRAAEQVPLLLSMGNEPLALSKALESGDADLVYLVILQLQRSRPPADFLRLMRSKPAALDLLVSYCKQQDVKLLQSLYADLDLQQERANLIVLDAYRQTDLDAKIAGLEKAMAIYAEIKDTFDAKATEEQIKLMLMQSEIDSSLGADPSQTGQRINWVGLPLGDTLFHLIQLGQTKRAAKLKADFKVPEPRFYWIKLNALAAVRDWAQLDKFCKDKKPPIGYTPFADVCLQAGEPREAAKYIPKIADLEERGNYWILARNFHEAFETAKLIKEPEKRGNLLTAIRSKATTDKELLQHVDAALQAIS